MTRISLVVIALLTVAGCSPAQVTDYQAATGMLKTRDYIVTMYAGSNTNGPQYSIRDMNGVLLDEELSMESLVALYPDLKHLENNDSIEWAGLDSTSPDSLRP